MEYACLIYASDDVNPGAEVYQEFMKISEEARGKGALSSARGFHDASRAKTVRVRDGEREVSDGPAVSAKEYLNGFFIFECKNMDEALEWAAKLPASKFGSVEVRPVRGVSGN